MIGAGCEMNNPNEVAAWHRTEVLRFFLGVSVSTYDELLHDRLAVEGHSHRSPEEKSEIADGNSLAVRALSGRGVLHQEGQTIFATRSAREVARLLKDEPLPDSEL